MMCGIMTSWDAGHIVFYMKIRRIQPFAPTEILVALEPPR